MKNPLIQHVDIKAQAEALFPGIQMEIGSMLFQIKIFGKDCIIFSCGFNLYWFP